MPKSNLLTSGIRSSVIFWFCYIYKQMYSLQLQRVNYSKLNSYNIPVKDFKCLLKFILQDLMSSPYKSFYLKVETHSDPLVQALSSFHTLIKSIRRWLRDFLSDCNLFLFFTYKRNPTNRWFLSHSLSL